MSILEQVQEDARSALKAGERERVGALRLVANALQQDDEVAVLRRERKRRLEAAEAYRSAGNEDRAAAERAEAELIDGYLPTQLPDAELDAAVEEAVKEAGATGPGDIGRVMGAVMPKLGGRADGKRVSDAVRTRLAGDG
jgi:uncharacterized protein